MRERERDREGLGAAGFAGGGARFASVGVAWGVVTLGCLALLLTTALMLRGVEPVATWYYLFAWYPVLLTADGVIALIGAAGARGEFFLLSRPRFALSVLFWSAVIWLFYELFNFRLQNWYYVNVPADRAARWLFTFLAFATVLPAVLLAERLLDGAGIARRLRTAGIRMTPARLAGMQIVGAVFIALVLVWPRLFFPLVWGGTTLIVEPVVYRRDPARSLLGDLERGEPGRIIRLLMGGMAIGLLWESLNINARAKWIYTVPGLEEVKLFEMPVLGFFGFPPFALECFVLWQALVLAGLGVPRETDVSIRTTTLRRVAGLTAAGVFSMAVFAGMEGGRTWDSYRPTLAALDVPVAPLSSAGFGDPYALAGATPDELAAAGLNEAAATDRIARARIVTLRGIGTENARRLAAIGVPDIETLARSDPDTLIARLDRLNDRPVVPARIRVWVRGAREAVGAGSD